MKKSKRTNDGQVVQDAIVPETDASNEMAGGNGPLPINYTVGRGGEVQRKSNVQSQSKGEAQHYGGSMPEIFTYSQGPMPRKGPVTSSASSTHHYGNHPPKA